MEENLIKIKDVINDFFNKAGIIDFEIKTIEATAGGSLNVSLSVQDASLYIGEGGKNIGAFEAVLRLLIKKQLGEAFFLRLDINNYRSSKEESLKELAKKAARRARFYKQPVTLEAMSAYNRRIIHAELAAHPDIKTESTGEGLQRRVVIKFVE
ncbi:MAG: R3H domain-containing nucleic acid-binding protein [Candidatus Azambacteria bacterium]|nr:R3H domain-containing nucleic acid-binding protein [Candidatus Azambacteria bacterium]